MSDEELVKRLRDDVNGGHDMTPHGADCLQAADRIEALTDKLAQAMWLLTEAAVQLEEGKIKTRRNRAEMIWKAIDDMAANDAP
jgi:hypothetical protein